MRPAENIEHPNPTPIITTTKINRCTILRHNLITENNNLDGPGQRIDRGRAAGAWASSCPATTPTWSKAT